MLHISSPGLLFDRQKVFQLHHDVESLTAKCPYKMVLIYDFPAEELPAPLKEMTDKLIQACQFKQAETLYVNTNFSKDVSLGSLQKQYSPEFILLFGDISLSRNMMKLAKNQVYEINGIKALNTVSLETLAKNGAEKSALWGALKKALGI